MNLLILANNDIGLYNFRAELIERLLRDHIVHIALPEGDKNQKLVDMGCIYHPVALERRGMNPVSDLKLLHKYRSLMRTINPDFVITYTIKPNIYGGLAASSRNIPYASNITGLGTVFQNDGILKQLIISMYKASLRKTKHVFFENKDNASVFLNHKIIHPEQTVVLNGAGVNTASYPYLPYPSADEKVEFLFVGRIMKEKGIDELFQAMRTLQNRNVSSILHLVGFFEEEFDEKIQHGVQEGWLIFHGFQSDVRPFLEQCHCLILPSWHEGMANTILEASSCGRPVIASDIPGCRESVLDHKTGLLCQKQNPEDLADKMLSFCSLPLDKKREMGMRAREYMKSEFERNKVVDKTVAVLFGEHHG